MKRWLLIASVTAQAALASTAVDQLLSQDPTAQAERAFQRGDKRHLVIPVCGAQSGEVLPGWPPKDTREFWAAIENGNRPITCGDIEPDPGQKTFMRVRAFADKYNRRLLELDVASTK